MDRISTATRDSLEAFLEQLARKLDVEGSALIPFTDYTEMMTALLEHVGQGEKRLLIAGHASPDVAIAAERAGLEAIELPGASPFVNHPEDILQAADSPSSLVYLANPNRITGSNHSLQHVMRIAESIPDGMLMLDEKYYDYYGISALPLLERFDNIVVIRSLTAGFSISSDESGCLVGSTGFMAGLRNFYHWSRITTTMLRLLSTSLSSSAEASKRVEQVRDESLRLGNELHQMGVQNRITSADFLLLRVADTGRVAKALTGNGIPVDKLESHPDLQNYLRYRIQSPLSNDGLLLTFRRMPSEYYRLADIDKRAVMFHRPGETPHDYAAARASSRLKSLATKPKREEIPA
ncbi:MAG: aminotransferase class I/II-fold pyridoxal phosphate-dependent enzyme [candidate division Zixibacteria bacterium]|nr:aminotransferase class I/II-fold pyridoxal phosphate-dependent enzyme [candidate division Zixibacteria bacterium]